MENQHNPVNLGDGLIRHPPPPIDVHNQVVAENHADNDMRMQPPIPRPKHLCRGNVNINDSAGRLIQPTLPHGHTFVGLYGKVVWGCQI